MGNAFISRTVPVRLIIKHGTDLNTLSAAKSTLPREFEIANLADVGVAMAINEHLAGVCFSGLDGKIDFGVGFVGFEPPFRTWCRDLFDHYWKTAEKVRF
jgi:predicted transcriptional regulator